jgi:DmsE family decaheme c-type cytochrome
MRLPQGRLLRRNPAHLVASAITVLSLFVLVATAQDEDRAAGRVGRDMCLICHEVGNAFLSSVHSRNECEDCHGPGEAHMDAGGDPEMIRTPGAADWVDACQTCHSLGDRGLGGFAHSMHGRNRIACGDCHAIHPERGGFALLKADSVELCVGCHQAVEAAFRMPYHHPVREGAMECTDCHNPHGDPQDSLRRLEVVPGYGCVTCHADKKGPFVFRHSPVESNPCQTCHRPHGGFNAKLLVRSQVHQMCLECHSASPGLAFNQPPSFHDIRSPRYRNCTTCHREIHGSNVNPAFLR